MHEILIIVCMQFKNFFSFLATYYAIPINKYKFTTWSRTKIDQINTRLLYVIPRSAIGKILKKLISFK